ncbi:MAG: glycosyltransferase [Flavobacteriales bacterium]|nr:glycosyltransferase [Flavobacteriales bacterium]
MSIGLFSLFIYSGALLFIFIYSLVQANLVYNYSKKLKGNKNPVGEHPLSADGVYPMVTIQLPIFNEQYVVERLLKSVSEFNYPKDRFEIQVLDDSTDDTKELVADLVDQYKAKGFLIDHIHRGDREGYKAGALKEGLLISKGEFVAIFDADFTPQPNFIIETLKRFNNAKVGMVQTKWSHINKDYSLLTKLQAFGLDGHFTIEQTGRNKAGHFINFNGTGGMWRKSCIEDAGGWRFDTLTEDLDLSYHAQLKGWEFVYLEDFNSPGELPVAIASLKSQQYRWTKGAAENAKKHLVNVLTAKLGFVTKLHALFHLMNSFIFICVFSSAVVSIPLLFFKYNNQQYSLLFGLASLLLVSFLILIAFYWASYTSRSKDKKKAFREFIYLFPAYLSISMGLSFYNSIAVVEAWMGRKTPFVRTPKFNLNEDRKDWKSNAYFVRKLDWIIFIEGALAIYFLYGIVVAFQLNDFGLFPFHLMLSFGFGTIFFYSLKQSWLMK